MLNSKKVSKSEVEFIKTHVNKKDDLAELWALNFWYQEKAYPGDNVPNS